MGNISGVAIAIIVGGPGAIFWMWISALVGMATKFFTCTLSILYRGHDSEGKLQGGPMYFITEGLGKKWKPLAIFFSIAGLFGCTPMFQSNQLTQILRDTIFVPMDILGSDTYLMAGSSLSSAGFLVSDIIVGLVLAFLVALVIFGGIKRIGSVTAGLVPLMVLIYVLAVVYIIISNYTEIPYYFSLIITDAFQGNYANGEAMFGGALGFMIITGIRRAAFSNEAGIGTEAMAHGAAKTREPVREGLVAMLEPAIDTLLVCTMTALAILMTGVWLTSDADGITLTAMAFSQGIPGIGNSVLIVCVVIFSITTMFTYNYYGAKCFGFLFGAEKKHYYNYFYLFAVVFGSVASIDAVVSLLDGMFAMMAIPTMVGTLILAPKVMQVTRDYFKRKDSGEFD